MGHLNRVRQMAQSKKLFNALINRAEPSDGSNLPFYSLKIRSVKKLLCKM